MARDRVRRRVASFLGRIVSKRSNAANAYGATVDHRGLRYQAFSVATTVWCKVLWPLLRWLAPLLSLHSMYCIVWLKDWWLRGGKWVWPPAAPAPRVAFVVLFAVIPYWAALMAIVMVAWAFLRRRSNRPSGRASTRNHDARRPFLWPDYIDQTPMLVGSYVGDDTEEGKESDDDLDTGVAIVPLRPQTASVRWCVWLCVYIALAAAGLYTRVRWEQPNDIRFRSKIVQAVEEPRSQGYGKGEKVLIAAIFHNNADVLPYWMQQMTRVVQYLGPDNVYVSIMESYSSDDTGGLLHSFAEDLTTIGVAHRILTNDTSVKRPKHIEQDINRIMFLAAARNRVLEPLDDSQTNDRLGGSFDRIIFSNDVFVNAETIIELLDSRGGDYDMVCGLDFGVWGLYDAWVIRDRLGNFASSIWPYLFDPVGHEAIKRDEPGRVFTCWNGIVAMRAEPFVAPAFRRNGTLSGDARSLPPSHPLVGTEKEHLAPRDRPALRFRAHGPRECFSSECFLLPYDMQRLFGMEKIYINPRVINAYVWDHYLLYKYVLRHPVIKWFIENVEAGRGMHEAQMIVGDKEKSYLWDGGTCQPFGLRKRA